MCYNVYIRLADTKKIALPLFFMKVSVWVSWSLGNAVNNEVKPLKCFLALEEEDKTI